MDLSHSRPHRQFETAPVKPFDKFLAAVEVIAANSPETASKSKLPPAKIHLGDARKLSLRANSVDLVLTSPPYLNAIDYMRCSKFSLVWMGYTVGDLRRIRCESVGAEAASEETSEEWIREIIRNLRMRPKLSSRVEAILERYVLDMGRALSEVARVLRKGGRAVYVVGDSTIKGTFIRNSSIIAAVAAANGLALRSRRSRQLPANRRYLPPPRALANTGALDARMRKEVILVFSKTRKSASRR
jgi:hypothetical protein